MANEFKPINTQEEFDTIIKDRIARNTKTVTDEVTKKYEGYISPDALAAKEKDWNDKINALNTQAGEKDKSISALTAQNKAYELGALRSRIAHEKGIPYELAQRLAGETEEDIGKDADILAKFISSKPKQSAPLKSTESGAGKDAALSATIDKLNI